MHRTHAVIAALCILFGGVAIAGSIEIVTSRLPSALPDGRIPIPYQAVITKPGSYVVVNDIAPRTQEKPLLEVRADDVTIDLNGFALIGNAEPDFCAFTGILVRGERVRVGNGRIRGDLCGATVDWLGNDWVLHDFTDHLSEAAGYRIVGNDGRAERIRLHRSDAFQIGGLIEGDDLTIRDSFLEGPTLTTSSSLVTGSSFSMWDSPGLIVNGDGNRIVGNDVGGEGGLLLVGSTNLVLDNELGAGCCFPSLELIGDHNLARGNVLSYGELLLSGNGNHVVQNTILVGHSGRQTALRAGVGQYNILRGNQIQSAFPDYVWRSGIIFEGSDGLISGNLVSLFSEHGIVISGDRNNYSDNVMRDNLGLIDSGVNNVDGGGNDHQSREGAD